MSSKQKLDLANAIAEIIPLDPESCNQMVNYGLSLPPSEIENHFHTILGESDATTAFLIKFMDIKNHKNTPTPKPTNISAPKPTKSSGKAWTQEKPVKQQAPKKPKPTTTSELLKLPEPPKEPKEKKKSAKKQLDNLKDLEAVLHSLETRNADDNFTVCHCNATKHPLFDIAPNCLNCGKIICAREGLQPCSFCGHELLSAKDRQEIRDVLLQERHGIDHKIPERRDSPKPKQKKITVSLNAGENLWKAQDAALKQAEAERKQKHEREEAERHELEEQGEQERQLEYYNRHSEDPDLLAAQERLSKLLEFQDNGEERTKIIDNAADYELTSSNSGNMWLSATERALRLKKQQKQMRKYEETEQKRIGKGKRTVEMVIKDGKVTMVEKYSTREEEDENDKDSKDIKDLENQLKSSKKKNEEVMAQNTWDYDADKDKWEKPVYASKPDSEIVELPGNVKKRVQLVTGDQIELIANLY